MLVINKYVYDWFVSSKFPKLGHYKPRTDVNIHKIVNDNAGLKINTTPLSFLKTMQYKNLGVEKYLNAYYNQDYTYYVPEGDPRRLLSGRLLRKIVKKNK